MTREEVIKLLQMMRAAYPNVKLTDPKMLISAWELAFGEDDAEVIYKAARHHMNTNKFFPTVADIRKSISKGKLIYGNTQSGDVAPKIKAPNTMISLKPYCTGAEICLYYEIGDCGGTKDEWEACNI